MARPEGGPPPIRTDHSNAFASNTMRVRVPEILQQTCDTNPDYPAAIKAGILALRDSVAADGRIPLLRLPAPDLDAWWDEAGPHLGETWHHTEWFFAEVYTYRLLIEAIWWWETGRDPFLPIKQEEERGAGLWEMVEEALALNGPDVPAEARLNGLLHSALWGNRIDLSFRWSLERGTEIAHDDLLIDDSAAAVRQLLTGSGPTHYIADNYGREIAMDIVLIDALLEVIPAEVILHLKRHPTYVSDATIPDVLRFLELAEARGGAVRRMSERLQAALGRRLWLACDPYWNSTRTLWEMPPLLRARLAPARLAIAKGDVNYRRMVGDIMWPGSLSFAAVVRDFPAPLLCLRALKSDGIAGLSDDLMAALDRADPDWRWNGKRGVMQLYLPGQP